jgi:hypothetical protein
MSSVNKYQPLKGRGGVVRKATKPWGVAVLVLFVSLWVVVIPEVTAVSAMEVIRLVGTVFLPAAIGATLLFAYFEWRTRLVNRIRNQRHEHGRAL